MRYRQRLGNMEKRWRSEYGDCAIDSGKEKDG